MPESGVSIVKARVTLQGTSGLVLDNIDAMIDPLQRRKKELVSKKSNITEAEQEQVYLLEWRMSLYLSGLTGEPVVPMKCILAAMTSAARSLRKGKDLERGAIQLSAAEFPVIYDGPRDVEGLWAAGEQFQFKTIVNLTPTTPTRSMGVRVRPIFREWSLVFDALVMLDQINWGDFENILEITGRQGLCNARRIGYGRFTPAIQRL